ncbi:MAG: alpha-amylase family glycosyl hydrolase [Acidobacteriota bacterium]|nr:alpha-amylase family glycosyl hydrolase [Acidobacteriota bacterium]
MKKTFRLILLIGIANFACLLTAASAQNQAPQVEKVEPPNWWANHTINPVRLLVRGGNFQNARVASRNNFLKISNVKTNSRGDYLFFDVTISANAKAGKYDFEVSAPGGKTTIPFEISAPLDAKTNFQSVTNEDVIYLIMTDRFADGDASNNNPKDAPASANNRRNSRAWHGGDFQGVIDKLPYLKDLGVTAIWLTPWYDNPNAANECDKPWCPYTNYHGYHAIDYYGVEDHFGTMADLQRMIREAHRQGIKVIQDQVANHVGLQHAWAKNPPLDNWFSQFSQNSFNNSVLLSPNASRSERDNLLKGWFNEFLPDLNQDEPEVARYEIQNALWWIAMTGIDGIRQDTIQYMPRPFIRDWSAAIKKQYPKLYLVGEVFERDSAQTAFFQGGKTGWDGVDTNLPSVFDFKLWETSQEVFTGKKPVRALRDVLKYDGLYPNINNVTTLTNNHDTDRFMSLKGATLEGAMLHTAFILSTRGIPQLYYGEEIAMTGGHDPDNRKDFAGGWREDKINKFTREGRTADEQRMFQWTQEWIKIRRNSLALQKGKTIDLYYDNDVYIFARTLLITDITDTVIVAINKSEQPKEISLNGIFPKGDLVRLPLKGRNLVEFTGEKNTLRLLPKSAVAFGVH